MATFNDGEFTDDSDSEDEYALPDSASNVEDTGSVVASSTTPNSKSADKGNSNNSNNTPVDNSSNMKTDLAVKSSSTKDADGKSVMDDTIEGEDDVDVDVEDEDKDEDKDSVKDAGQNKESEATPNGTMLDASSNDMLDTDAVFSKVATTPTSTVSFDDLYKIESNSELIAALSKKTTFIKPTLKLLLIGLEGEYRKLEPSNDYFGFLMDKTQKEKAAMYQTTTCKAVVHHVNAPSLNNSLKVDLSKAKGIFDTAVAENDAASILLKLKNNGYLPSVGEETSMNPIVSINTFTPFPEMMFTEANEGEGKIVILEGNNMENTFDFLSCVSLLMDSSSPKKILLSTLLNTLAESGAAMITLVNLCTSSKNPTVTSPTKTPEDLSMMSDKTMKDDTDTDTEEEEEDMAKSTEKSSAINNLEEEEEKEKEKEKESGDNKEELNDEIDNNIEEEKEESNKSEKSSATSATNEEEEEEEEEDDDLSKPEKLSLSDEDVSMKDVEEVPSSTASDKIGGKKSKKTKKRGVHFKEAFKKNATSKKK
jgi:hypothetical protein